MGYWAAVRGFWVRLGAIVIKEVMPLCRDRLSFAMMFGMPILELLLFGYAINTDPHHLPTAMVVADQSRITRTVLSALANTSYMDFTHRPLSESEADALLRRGEVQFVVRIPSDFTRRLIRGERTQVLIDADATDPMSASNSLAAASPAIEQALTRDLVGPLESLSGRAEAVELVLHRRYNPEGMARLNIVPGLLAVILSVTMVLMTALAVTRERELGTMENLLATPARPLEVMIGKIVPYFVIGLIQTGVILVLSWLLFDIAVEGSLTLLLLGTACSSSSTSPSASPSPPWPKTSSRRCSPPSSSCCPRSCCRLHVPVPRHAGMGAVAGRDAAGHALHPHRPWRDAEGRDLRRHRRRTGGSRHHPHRRVGAGDQPLPHHPGRRCETGGLTAASRAGKPAASCPRPRSTRPTRSPA